MSINLGLSLATRPTGVIDIPGFTDLGDGTFSIITDETGDITVTMAGGVYDGATKTFDPAELDAGPVNIAVPTLTGDADPEAGEDLTILPGLWVYDGDNSAPAISYASNGSGVISGLTYTSVSADAGVGVNITETATGANGSRSADSNAITFPAPWSEGDSFAQPDGTILNTEAAWEDRVDPVSYSIVVENDGVNPTDIRPSVAAVAGTGSVRFLPSQTPAAAHFVEITLGNPPQSTFSTDRTTIFMFEGAATNNYVLIHLENQRNQATRIAARLNTGSGEGTAAASVDQAFAVGDVVRVNALATGEVQVLYNDTEVMLFTTSGLTRGTEVSLGFRRNNNPTTATAASIQSFQMGDL